LPTEAIRNVICHRLQMKKLSDNIFDDVIPITNNNPLIAIEISDYLKHSGIIFYSDFTHK
jgi:hypothetical protein